MTTPDTKPPCRYCGATFTRRSDFEIHFDCGTRYVHDGRVVTERHQSDQCRHEQEATEAVRHVCHEEWMRRQDQP